MSAGVVLGWAVEADAQYLFDVGQQQIQPEQLTSLRARQAVLPLVEIAATNSLVIPMGRVGAPNTTLLLQNEDTGQNVVLSGFTPGSREIVLPPLLLAELRAGTLGEASRYRYTVLETGSNGTTTPKSQAAFFLAKHEIPLPVFNYGPADAVKSTAIAERKVVGVGKAKPHVLLANEDDAALVARAAQMEEAAAYYVYTYQLPDGSLATYDEQLQSVNLKATVPGSLTFQVTATGSTAEQDVANAYAAGLWGKQLSGSVPVAVSITFADLGVGNENVIGQSWQPAVYKSGNIYYPSALRNQKVGYDINKQMADIRLEFNTKYSFYYGTNGICPSGQIDYASVLLHEICHGLGFFPSIDSTTGLYGSSASTPWIFDTFLYYNGARLTASTSATRVAALTSGALYWDGANAVAANGGNRIKLYAPSTYQSGSSVSHWDESVTFSTFMKYAYHGPVHTFNTRKMGLMKDLGWTLAAETVIPSAPAKVAASDDRADEVLVTWSVSTNASSYKIYRYTSNASASALLMGTSSATSYDDAAATPGVTYYYWVKAVNGNGASGFSGYDTGIRINPAAALATALDSTGLTWTTGGDVSWFSQTAITHDGVDAARSGAILDGQESWLKTTVTGPGTLSYWAAVSSQADESGADTLSLDIDGSAASPVLSGEAGWTHVTKTVFTGDHDLVWNYVKDSAGSAGSDCAWLDEVSFVPIVLETQSISFSAAGGDSAVPLNGGQTNETSIRSLEDCPAWLSDLVIRDAGGKDQVFDRVANSLSITGGVNELRLTAFPNATPFVRSWMVEVLWPGGGKQLVYRQDAGPVTLTVTFDPQGGTVSPSSNQVTYGAVYGSLPTPVKASCDFGGWWTGENGSGTHVTESTAVTNVADHTLHAWWLIAPTFTVASTNGLLLVSAVASTNATVVWESSTNLLEWAPWKTNTFTNGFFDMHIPIGTNDQEYFRLRLP